MFKPNSGFFIDFDDVIYKCKLSGKITADPGTGRQTLLAYRRSDGEFIGACVWDDSTHEYELFLQEHSDENIMLTRRDDAGVFFAETYDRLSLCQHVTSQPAEFIPDRDGKRIDAAHKYDVTSYPSTIVHENLLQADGKIVFGTDLTDAEYYVSTSKLAFPRKFCNLVQVGADNLVVSDDAIILVDATHILNNDPFEDESLLCAYSLVSNGRDSLGVYNTDIPSIRFTSYGGYDFYNYTNKPNPIVPEVIVDRTGSKTIYLRFRLNNNTFDNYHSYLLYSTNIFSVTLYSNDIYFYTINGTSTISGSFDLGSAYLGEHTLAVVINPSGNDYLYFDGVLKFTRAVTSPTSPVRDNLTIAPLKLGTHHITLLCAAIFSRGLSLVEINTLGTSFYNFNGLEIQAGTAYASEVVDSELHLLGDKVSLPTPQVEFRSVGGFGNYYASGGSTSVYNGITVYEESILFNGTSGYLYKSDIPDISNIDIYLRFKPSAVTAQCIWKIGNSTQGVAIGIDASAKLTLYVRNSGTLTSSAFTDALVTATWYKFILKNTDISLYADDDTLIETKAHGLIIGTYTGDESVGAAYNGSPILGTTGNSGFFSGHVSDLLITDKNTLDQKQVVPESIFSIWQGDEELPFEIIKWDFDNKEIKLWTKIPTVESGSDTSIVLNMNMLSTKSGKTGSRNAAFVWNHDFLAVYHMIPDSELLDSTANKFNGILHGVDSTNFVDHATGYTLSLNGVDEYVEIPFPVLDDTQRASVYTVFNADTISQNDRIIDIALEDAQNSGQQFLLEYDASNQLVAKFVDSDELTIGTVNTGVLSAATEYCVAVDYNGKSDAGSLSLLVDGVQVDTDAATAKRVADNLASIHIGKDAFSETYYDGSITELFITKKHLGVDVEKIMRLSMKDELFTFTESFDAAEVLWTPAAIDTALWLDAADTDTVIINNISVTQWSDKSGLGRHAVAATGEVLRDSSGLGAMVFDGSSALQIASFDDAYCTAFVVCERVAPGPTRQSILRRGDSYWSHLFRYNYPTWDLHFSFQRTGGSSAGTASDTSGAPAIYSALTRSADTAIWTNGQAYSIGLPTSGVLVDSNFTDPDMYVIGGEKGSGWMNFLIGRIMEVVFLNVLDLSDAERQRMEGYLAHKWGLSSNLPPDHPYKDSAPTVSAPQTQEDPYWDNTVLLMNMNGANGSTTFVDEKEHTVTPYGNAQISTAQSKFGGASAYFDGNGDCLTIPSSSDFDFGIDSFTIEMWVYVYTISNVAYPCVISKRNSYTSNHSFTTILFPTGIQLFLSSNGGSTGISITSTTPIPLQEWHHIAFVRSSNYLYIFLDGVMIASRDDCTLDVYTSSTPLTIGGFGSPVSPDSYFSGHVDDLRITKGVARYTEDFTPPDRELSQFIEIPASMSGIMGTVPSGTINADQKNVPVMLHLSAASGVTNFDLSSLFGVDYLRYTGNNPIKHQFGMKRAGVSIFNINNILMSTGPKYELNGARRFDGTANSIIDITNSISRYSLLYSLSLSLWIKLEYLPTAEHLIFGTNAAAEFQLIIRNNRELTYRHTSSGFAIHTWSLPPNKWCHVALVRDTVTKKINFYLNGKLVYADWSYTTVPAISTNAIYIGGNSTTKFIGCIGDIKLYSQLLTASQIKALYNESTNVYSDEIITGVFDNTDIILLGESLSSITINDSYEEGSYCWYSVSFDEGSTYSIYTGTVWKHVATTDDAIHGHTGETAPYYWDDDSSEWVYSRTDMIGTISMAMLHEGNRMDAVALNAVSDYTLFDSSIGKVNVAASMLSDGNSNPTVSSIIINNKNYWISEEYVLSDFCETVSKSSASYAHQIPDGTADYKTATKLYCWITGGTSWVECVNGTIPNVPVGLTTTGKSIKFRLVWDLDVWIDPKDVVIEFTIK